MNQQFNTITKILKEIYPLKILLLVLAPELIGLIIDYDLFDSRYVIIDLIWVLIFTIPFNLSQKKFVYRLGTVIYFLVGLIEIAHWIILKGPVTLTSLMVIANTNYNEATEFMDLKASFWLLVLIPYTVLFVVAFKTPPTLNKSKKKNYIIAILAVVAIIFISENVINERFIRKGVPQIVKVTCSFFEKMSLYKEAMKETKPKQLKVTTNLVAKQQTFVLILGESCSRRHMSLYGYAKSTNPKLGLRKDLVKYTNVVSPYSSTLNSVLSIMSNSSLENKIDFDKSIDLLDVFHSAGFKTYWLSNQSPIGIWDNLVTVLAKKSDYTKFVNISSNSSFEATQSASYDMKLIEPLKKVLDEKVSRKFIVVHLMGSHSAYSKRYPSEFNIFKGSDSKQQTIAEYDNSMLYNDYVVNEVLNTINKEVSMVNNTITSVIYLADHGENVYDEEDHVGHDYANGMPRVNVEIPFLVWLSPEFIKQKTPTLELIQKNSNNPFVTDDLFHSVIDLNGIEGDFFEKNKSVFNKEFNILRERILEDGRDYDKKK